MNIKNKIKSTWARITGKRAKQSDSELGAEEVVKKEVFPKSAKTKTAEKKVTTNKNGCTKKRPSERTRPKNSDYQMIDPDCDTCDTGKS